VAVVGLLAVLLSPVAWIHHLAWVVLVLGVLAGDLRDRRRVMVALAVGIFYGLQIPWYGQHLLRDHAPLAFAVPLQDGFGLAAVILVATLPARSRLSRSDQLPHVSHAPFGEAVAS
jgi:alpha-1,2-mannosyltransferase